MGQYVLIYPTIRALQGREGLYAFVYEPEHCLFGVMPVLKVVERSICTGPVKANNRAFVTVFG